MVGSSSGSQFLSGEPSIKIANPGVAFGISASELSWMSANLQKSLYSFHCSLSITLLYHKKPGHSPALFELTFHSAEVNPCECTRPSTMSVPLVKYGGYSPIRNAQWITVEVMTEQVRRTVVQLASVKVWPQCPLRLILSPLE